MGHIGPPAKQKRVDLLHDRAESRADIVVPVGARPAAVREPVVAILVSAARGLNDAVEGDELVNDELSQDVSPWLRGDVTPPETTTNEQSPDRQSMLCHQRGAA